MLPKFAQFIPIFWRTWIAISGRHHKGPGSPPITFNAKQLLGERWTSDGNSTALFLMA